MADERSYKKEINASEILAKIEKGEDVEYDGYIIKGDLDIRGLKPSEKDGKTTISSNISIINSRFDGRVCFENTVFKRSVYFSDTIFSGKDEKEKDGEKIKEIIKKGKIEEGEVSEEIKEKIKEAIEEALEEIKKEKIENETIKNDVIKEKIKEKTENYFEREFQVANFSDAIFSGKNKIGITADFDEALFEGLVRFNAAQFSGYTTFHKTKFCGFAFFTRAQFKDIARFEESYFKSFAYFEKAQFEDVAMFDAAKFRGSDCSMITYYRKGIDQFECAWFVNAQFKGFASFTEVQFNNVSFFMTRFSDIASFVGGQFNGTTEFDYVSFGETANFLGACFSKNFSLKNTKYEKLYIRWGTIFKSRKWWEWWKEDEDRITSPEYNAGNDLTYLTLIENFKNIGFFEDADDCYYYYRVRRTKNIYKLTMPSSSFFGFLNSLWYRLVDLLIRCLYGYGVKPIRPFIWSVIAFFAFGISYYATATTPLPMGAFNLSYMQFLSGAKLIETPLYASTGMIYFVLTCERVLATVFLALFVISLGKTIIR